MSTNVHTTRSVRKKAKRILKLEKSAPLPSAARAREIIAARNSVESPGLYPLRVRNPDAKRRRR